jgi:hypothetical protein
MQRRERLAACSQHAASDTRGQIIRVRLIEANGTTGTAPATSPLCMPAVYIAARPDLINAIIHAAPGRAPVRSSELLPYVNACLHGVDRLSLGDAQTLNRIALRVGIDPLWRSVSFFYAPRR